MKKNFLVIVVCVVMVGCNNNGGVAERGVVVGDSVAVEDVVSVVKEEVKKDEHEYVDLGLESGTLWAVCNVGAEKPEEYGDYFAWGETETKEEFSQYNNKWREMNTEELKAQGVIDEKGNLTAKYDAATVNWGKEWRMPTKEEVEELRELKSENVTVNGVKGRMVFGKNGKTLFLPFGGAPLGYRNNLENVGKDAHFWTATAEEGDVFAYYMLATSEESDFNDFVDLLSYYRNAGYSVRAVRKIKN